MNKLFLIDAYALIFRFYYALINRPMRNSQGLNTSAIWGFTKFINDLIAREKPTYIGVAFDPKGGSFRNQQYPLYKANRSETPEDIKASVPYIKQILQAMNIPIYEVMGYEADDVIGTLSVMGHNEGLEVFMVTPDKDYGQLITDKVSMYKPRKGGADSFEIVRSEDVCKYYSIDKPCKVRDILALWGDASDNVPGVPGIGEKSAIKLISSYGDIEGIYDNIDKLKGKQKENLIEHKDRLMLARDLVTICTEVPLDFKLEDLRHKPSDHCQLISLYREMNFATMIHDLELKCGNRAQMPIEEVVYKSNSGELMLFDSDSSQQGETTSQLSLFDSNDLFGDRASEPVYNTIKNTAHTYIPILTPSEADALAEAIKLKGEFCFDTETTGLNPMMDSLVGVSISIEQGKAYYIPAGGEVDIKASLGELFEDDSIAKVGQNIKFDILVLKSIGIEVKGPLFDTMIYLINPDLSHNMDFLARNYLNYNPIAISELIGSGRGAITMDRVELSKITDYAAEDADITLQLKELLWLKLTESGLDKLYFEIEEPLIRVLADMEYTGVKVDSNILDEFSVLLKGKLEEIEQSIRQWAEGDININSPKQLGELLFDKLKITTKAKRTKTKQYKTDEASLEKLIDKHPIVGQILEYREAKKLLSTYALALTSLINPKTGRVHTTYNQALTRTGRLSSNNPNLQNIPIRNPRGEVIRKAFVAENSNRVLLAADYSQIELRIMAHLSGDPAMIEAFREGEDIHTATAAKIYGVEQKNVSKTERSNAKSANFGIIYGISSFGLANNLKIPASEAKALIDGYFASYPMVHQYMDNSVEMARQRGYAATIYGRKRYLEDINSRNATVRSFAERNAINAPIQGSAADIMKLAMIRVSQRLNEEGLKSKIILQVHDELVLEVEKSELESVMAVVRESMEGAAELNVPLPVDMRYADNWLDAH